jgi:hypothetical protein
MAVTHNQLKSRKVYLPVQNVSDFIFSRKNQWRQVGKSDHSGGGTFMSMRDLLRPPGASFSLIQLVCKGLQ